MPRYDDRRSSSCTRLYVGHLSPRVRSRDLEDIFSRYGRIRDVDMKRDYAFVEFSDPRDADDAQYNLNGREIKGSRIVVEFSKGVPRGTGGSRDLVGRGPPPGSGRCFNCGIDGHWARDCKAGDWKNKCYRCGERGHIERNCQNSPKKLRRGRSYSRSPTPRRYRRSRSYSRSRSRSMSPVKRDRNNDDALRRSRSPRYSQSPERARSPSPSRGRKRSLTPEDRSPRNRDSPTPEDRSPRNRDSLTPEDRSPRGRESPKDCHYANGSDYSGSPRARSKSPVDEAEEEGGRDDNRSPAEENGRSRSRSPSPAQRDGESPSENENRDSPRGSE